MPKDIATMSHSQLRAEYKRIARWSGLSPRQFNDRVASILSDHGIVNAKPLDFVTAARSVGTRCECCSGTGLYIKYVENGKPKGNGGICYRCEGKGYQTIADFDRNMNYDLYFRQVG